MNKVNVVFIIIVLFFSSCKTTQTIFGGKLKELSVTELDEKLRENTITFTTFSAKAKIDVASPTLNQSVNAQIDILKDSVIGISLRLLGVEGMRIKITPDSILIIDRLNQQYIPRPFSFIESSFSLPLDFRSLQDLIAGNPVFYDSTTLTAGTSDDKYVLFAQKGVYKNTVWLDNDFNILRMFIEDLEAKRSLTLSYSAIDKIEGRQFAFMRSVLIQAQNELTATIEFSKITFNEPFEFTFNVNSKYERID